MTANDSKFYLSYLNKLISQYNNTHHHYICKKSIFHIGKKPALTEKVESQLN